MNRNGKLIIAVDFDGTIVEHDYPRVGKLLPDAKEIINKLYGEGHTILIWTVRSSTGDAVNEAIRFLNDNNINFHYINHDADEITSNPAWTDYSRKIYADVYIDDRNLGGLLPWKQIYKEVNKMINNHKGIDEPKQ